VPNPLLEALASEASGCTKCPLAHQGRTQVVFGMGYPEADLMFVGEGPGAEEDRQGLPFVGKSGKLLDRIMAEELGIDRSWCYVANCVKCRPPGNRDPLPLEIDTCRPYLERQIELIEPRVIITLGRFAAQLLLDTKEGINRLRGRVHPYRGTLIVPTFHPAAVLRGGGETMARMRADFVRAKRALIEVGAEPWARLARAEATA
jgi:DNA polymerase